MKSYRLPIQQYCITIPITKSILEMLRTDATGCCFVFLKKITYTEEKRAGANGDNSKPENNINNTGRNQF